MSLTPSVRITRPQPRSDTPGNAGYGDRLAQIGQLSSASEAVSDVVLALGGNANGWVDLAGVAPGS